MVVGVSQNPGLTHSINDLLWQIWVFPHRASPNLRDGHGGGEWEAALSEYVVVSVRRTPARLPTNTKHTHTHTHHSPTHPPSRTPTHTHTHTHLGDRLGLDPVAEDAVERDGPGGDALDRLFHLLLLETCAGEDREVDKDTGVRFAVFDTRHGARS